MNQDDDPEARIRELERPLADAARTSEMGSSQTPGGYPPPAGPPAPPPVNYGTNYGTPFPPTAPRSFSFNRTWWIFIAAFVIVPMVITGFIAFNMSRQLSNNGITTLLPTPSLSPSPGSNSPPSSVTRTPGATASASPPVTPLPPAGGDLGVSGINANRTIACNASNVRVSGIQNKVVITGHCTSLSVSGVQNSITVDTVDSIEVSGFNNQITYHTGSPSIDKSGDGNVVQQG
jgi:hypothetical protein